MHRDTKNPEVRDTYIIMSSTLGSASDIQKDLMQELMSISQNLL